MYLKWISFIDAGLGYHWDGGPYNPSLRTNESSIQGNRGQFSEKIFLLKVTFTHFGNQNPKFGQKISRCPY